MLSVVRPEPSWFERGEVGLFTDLYEITMAACYYERAMAEPATFSLLVRRLPPDRSYLVAAGLDEALRHLENLRFGEEALAYLRGLEIFREAFLEHLGRLRFTGDVVAVPEGTPVLAQEPLLELTAPIDQAQLCETFLLNAVQSATLFATKAARVVRAAGGRRVVDFAPRRAHGREASLNVARASYLAGFDATSNVLAGKEYGIPITGTLAHSFIQSFQDEAEAFRAFARVFPEDAVFLIDTYDSLEGARKAAAVGKEMRQRGRRLKGVRLDSGDIIPLSREVRRILDEAGLSETRIIASGSLDEYAIEAAVAAGAPIDSFGIGTQLGVSYDAPALDIVYKMVDYGGRPVLKLSAGKETLAGKKQVFRRFSSSGEMVEDFLGLRDESVPGTVPLLVPVMAGGRRLSAPEPIEALRERTRRALSSLPEALGSLRGNGSYRVRKTDALERLQGEWLSTAPARS
jgi:nicotinate phosphoribosyltransferase